MFHGGMYFEQGYESIIFKGIAKEFSGFVLIHDFSALKLYKNVSISRSKYTNFTT